MAQDLRTASDERLLELRHRAQRDRRDPFQRARIAKIDSELASRGLVVGKLL